MRGFTLQQLAVATEQLEHNTSAHYWIQHRELPLKEILSDLLRRDPVEKYFIEHSTLADNARAEATISPSEPVRDTPVSIESFEREIRVMFPYSDRDFWEIIKLGLGYDWSGSYWVKTLEMTNSTITDLAAEAGHKLLDASYKVVIWDEIIREKAVAGDYKPCRTRWIFVDDDGNFAIKYNYYEDLYDEARKITGSKYKKPYVRVIPSEFLELLDFAELHDFRFTQEAEGLIEEQKRIALEVTLTDVAPLKARKAAPRRPSLNPEDVTGEIHEDLRDD